MKQCEVCGKNDANVHITQMVQNETTAFHLCEECARKKGISISIEDAEVLISGESAPGSVANEPAVACPHCRLSYADFKTGGWLGCDACYTAFDEQLDQLFKQVHGAVTHTGKQYRHRTASTIPHNQSGEIKKLQLDLANAIQNEEFELAASLRDAIHACIPQTHGTTA